jgi:hypothetical protein
MIEGNFFKGARFRWNKPSDVSSVEDGAIVNNPAVIANPMVYVGMDKEIYISNFSYYFTSSLTGPNINTNIPYNWLCYVLGQTARLGLTGDILTGFMSGCWITTWLDLGGRYVGHVGTIERVLKTEAPNTTVKTQFRTTMPPDVLGYSPADAWSFDEIKAVMSESKENLEVKILSLVTINYQFYSILFLRRMSEPSIWICGGSKKVNPTAYQGLIAALQ